MRPVAILLALPLACAKTDDGRSGATTFLTLGPADDDGAASEGGGDDDDDDDASGESDGALGTVGAASGGPDDDDDDDDDDDAAADSSGGSVAATYPDCVAADLCADETARCLAFEDGSVCGDSCVAPVDCPAPVDGDASPTCATLDGYPPTCALDCAEGQACPSGMLCDLVLGEGAFCVWP